MACTTRRLVFLITIVVCLGELWGAVLKEWDPPLVEDAVERMIPSTDHILEDCMHVTSEAGDYFFKTSGVDLISDGQTPVCGLYLLTDPDRRIEVMVRHLDVPCDEGGLLAWIDGWELNGQMFPGPMDRAPGAGKQFSEFCGSSGPTKIFRSSQNAALIQYKVPQPHHNAKARPRGFQLSVRFIPNYAPCNILVEGIAPAYTLRNYGKRGNCSLSAVYPGVVRVLSSSVGGPRLLDMGTLHKCEKRGLLDFVQVAGSDGLDSSNQQTVPSICGQDPKPGPEQAVFCGVTTVRLVSSGHYDNSITVSLRPAAEDDIPIASIVCGAK